MPADNYITGGGGPAPAYQILQTSTSAYIALTVYPTTFNIAASDYQQLGEQILNYTTNYNRSVFLRFAPEMQGQWFQYGFQPSQYIPMWQTMYTTLKTAVPSGLAIVWAPNLGQGYPYGQTTTVAADIALLDTSGDGEVTNADDPFKPYYPGDEYVDWVGLSVYSKGSNDVNAVPLAGFCGYVLDNADTSDPTAGPVVVDFYQVRLTLKLTLTRADLLRREAEPRVHVRRIRSGVPRQRYDPGSNASRSRGRCVSSVRSSLIR